MFRTLKNYREKKKAAQKKAENESLMLKMTFAARNPQAETTTNPAPQPKLAATQSFRFLAKKTKVINTSSNEHLTVSAPSISLNVQSK